MRVGVIGAGNLGMALAKNASKKAEVVAVKRKVVEMEGIEVTDRIEEVGDCDVILVALKPDVFRRELERIGRVAEEKPVVSFAAGVKLDEMRRHIKKSLQGDDEHSHIARRLLACRDGSAHIVSGCRVYRMQQRE